MRRRGERGEQARRVGGRGRNAHKDDAEADVGGLQRMAQVVFSLSFMFLCFILCSAWQKQPEGGGEVAEAKLRVRQASKLEFGC